MNDYNRRFAKAPRRAFDVHRELDVDDDLDMVFNWREARKVSKSLTVQYDKVLYLIEDSEFSRRAIGKYIDVWHYPDGHKELRLNGVSLPYSTYDKLSEIDQGAIVDNKRLGRATEMAQLVEPSGIITGRNPYHPETALLAGVKLPRRRNPSVPRIRTICSMPRETSVTL